MPPERGRARACRPLTLANGAGIVRRGAGQVATAWRLRRRPGVRYLGGGAARQGDAVAMRLRCGGDAAVMRRRGGDAVVMRWRCGGDAVAMRWRCGGDAVAMRLRRGGDAMWMRR